MDQTLQNLPHLNNNISLLHWGEYSFKTVSLSVYDRRAIPEMNLVKDP